MKSQVRLSIESLESRWCPALTTSFSSGVLSISGSADNGSIHLVQDSTTPGTFTVLDGTAATSDSPYVGVTRVRLQLTVADDHVTVDLGGKTFSGQIVANLGNGANDLTVQNGSIDGALVFNSEVPPTHHGFFGFFGRSRSSTPTDTGADAFTLAAGATVKSLSVRGGQLGNTIEVAGDVTNNVYINLSSPVTGAGSTVDISGEVDGNIFLEGSKLADSLSISGNVGGGVFARMGAGADKVSIAGAVTRGLFLDTGAGNDTITLDSTIGGRVGIYAGSGDDSLTISATAELLSTGVISMGAGADSVVLDDAATIARLLINGGSGTDTFTGTATRTGLRLFSF